MNVLLNDNINDIKNILETENECEVNKSYNIININKKRKTACEREAIFNRLILNNPTIISVDTTLLPGTCVYCNICQVRIILNPAYYLNNWRTHMNGKLHKALSKAVGSPQFLDEIDFCIEKEESYFDPINIPNYDKYGNINKIDNENINGTNCSIIGQLVFNNFDNNNNNQEINIINNNTHHKTFSVMQKFMNKKNLKKENNNIYYCYDQNQNDQNKVIEIIENNYCVNEEMNVKQIENYQVIQNENVDQYEKQINIDIKNQNNECVMHPLIANLSIEKDHLTHDYNFIINNDTLNEIYTENININNTNIENNGFISHNEIQDENQIEENTNINQKEMTNIDIPVISPLLRIQFEKIGTFHCPGINKVRYWAMCFIGSERSTEHCSTLNYNDTRRVFYKQSIITKITPNHEPEHQGVVHHPNCLEVVNKLNEPCERCSQYINNRQLARVISKRATRLQEMWDRVIAGESILNGGKIPQSIISAYNHRIDHWSRCNDPLEAITRALAGCRQRDYTNFFWKIRENLLQNSRLIKNHL